MNKLRFRVVGGVVLAVLLACGVIALAERQHIFDWWRLRGYLPPVTVQQLASETTMNAYARKVFYVNHPAVDAKSSFGKVCPNNGGEKTVVLGCYHSDQQGIYILRVSDPRLSGVEQVTAAHEMLHAAYDRLSTRDRASVDRMLTDYYQHGLHDKRVLATIAAYKKSEPNDVVNEMHSVFGTEVANLPAPLENYYKRYFTDRQKIVAYAQQYEGAFTSREQQVANDDTQLAAQKQQITSDEASLHAQAQAIDSEQTRLSSLKSTGDYSGYNALVPDYNTKVGQYNALVATVRALIAQYNQLVKSRNAIALEETQLVQDITTTPQRIN
jgi:hypothetical protein